MIADLSHLRFNLTIVLQILTDRSEVLVPQGVQLTDTIMWEGGLPDVSLTGRDFKRM